MGRRSTLSFATQPFSPTSRYNSIGCCCNSKSDALEHMLDSPRQGCSAFLLFEPLVAGALLFLLLAALAVFRLISDLMMGKLSECLRNFQMMKIEFFSTARDLFACLNRRVAQFDTLAVFIPCLFVAVVVF